MRNFKIFNFLFLLLLNSCAGYRFSQKRNPLKSFGIERLSLPMFINYSLYPRLNTYLTKEMYQLLNSYSDLTVKNGENLESDAILIGIVESADQTSQAFRVTSRKFTTGDLEDSIGKRPPFFIPTGVRFDARIRIFIIKNPTLKILSLTRSELKDFVGRSPQVVVSETLDLRGSYSQVVASTETVDNAGVVNYTKNKANFERALRRASESLIQNFREVVLNAF